MQSGTERPVRVNGRHQALFWGMPLAWRASGSRISLVTCYMVFLYLWVEVVTGQQPSLSRELLLFMEVPTVVTRRRHRDHR